MKFAVAGCLAALALTPFAAQGAQAPTRYSATLSARIIESYSYAETRREAECQTTRIGTTRREVVIRSLQPTATRVLRSGGRAAYRPAVLRRVRVTTSMGEGRWSQRRQCLGDTLPPTSGTCAKRQGPSRVVRTTYRWAGPNRLAFPVQPAEQVALCGLQGTVQTNAWLNVAPGRIDEEVLIGGRRPRVVARAEATRSGNLVESRGLSVGQEANVRWTLTFRRLR